MTVLGRMLMRMILARFLLIVVGVSVFVISLEVVANLDDILASAGGQHTAILRYMALRLPGMVSVFFTMSLLLAVVLTLVELGYRNEIVPIWAAGVSPLRLIVMLLPLGLGLGVAQFWLADSLVPSTVRQLARWGVGQFAEKKLQAGRSGVIWMRSGGDILRAGKANKEATRLEDVIIFRRDKEGLLTEQMFVGKARRERGRWLLRDVVIYRREPVPPTRVPAMVYSGELKLAAEGVRTGDPEEMSLRELDYFVQNYGFGLRPVHVYEAWWHKRLSTLVVPFLILAVCVPLATRFRRGSITGVLLLSGVAIGFGYFMFEGLTMTIGELGLVPPWLAGWFPPALLALLAAALLLRAQTVQ